MARLVHVNYRAAWCILAVGTGALVISFASLKAQPAPAPPKPAGTNAATATAPAKPPAAATNAAPKPDDLGRYGKILTPGDDTNNPLRLKMPFPGVGEVKMPTADEWTMREKLEQLSRLSDDQIRTELAQWPAFSHMSLRDEGTMLVRIQDFREYHARAAQQRAHDLGLLALTDEQKAKFEKEYWDKRLQLDGDLIKQFGSVYKKREQKINDDLIREFSSANPVAQASKPPAPKPTPPPATASTTNKPAATPPPSIGQSQPVAQSPTK